MNNNVKTAIGLMSGTSMDGIDVALIKSDGHKIISHNGFEYFAYDQKIKQRLKQLISGEILSLAEIKAIENEVTQKHIIALESFLKSRQLSPQAIDVIGFHGHTILHQPQNSITWQIGNAQMLASAININVVADFRTKDVIYGGQGAPLAPIYHHILLKDLPKPLAIINIGGVANITYLADNEQNNMVAFDIGFGNAPLDDLIKEKTGQAFDDQGKLAAQGKIDYQLAANFLSNQYFSQIPPKSLDRNQFIAFYPAIYALKLEDALATLAYIFGQSVKMALNYIPYNSALKEIIICGGGRKNLTLLENIRQATKVKVSDIDQDVNQLGFNGDAIEAEAFGILGIRSLLNLPISFTKTTGVLPGKHNYPLSEAVNFSSCGGVFYRA